MPNLAEAIANKLAAINNCDASGNMEWRNKHVYDLSVLLDDAPHGSGFDSGTSIDMERSGDNRLVFNTSFHHMDEVGGYDGWTEHTVTVAPHFVYGLDIRVSGRNRNEIKDYISELFSEWLGASV